MSDDSGGSDGYPEYQPLPWEQEIYNAVPFTHYCEQHHNNFDATSPVLHGYESRVLKEWANRLRVQSINNPTTAQQFLKYEFLAEYLLCDFETSSYEQICGVLEALSVLLDRYFFDGLLTQGPQKRLLLRIYPICYLGLYGVTVGCIRKDCMLVVQLLRNPDSGTMYTRAAVLDTLIHEMCHAFARLFYNFCPFKEDSQEELLEGSGHGALWRNLYYNACEVIVTWHPEFSYMDHYPKISSGEPEVQTYETKSGFAQALDSLLIRDYPPQRIIELVRPEWYGQTPGALNPKFRRAVFRLQYLMFRPFLFSRIPFCATIRQVALTLNRIFIFGLLLPMLWWHGWLELALTALCYMYMISNDYTFIVLLWSAVHVDGFAALVTTAWYYFRTWLPHWTSGRQPANSRTRDYPVWDEDEEFTVVQIVKPGGEIEDLPIPTSDLVNGLFI